jgi:hypothetical protein
MDVLIQQWDKVQTDVLTIRSQCRSGGRAGGRNHRRLIEHPLDRFHTCCIGEHRFIQHLKVAVQSEMHSTFSAACEKRAPPIAHTRGLNPLFLSQIT